jgi:hypothetical protein
VPIISRKKVVHEEHSSPTGSQPRVQSRRLGRAPGCDVRPLSMLSREFAPYRGNDETGCVPDTDCPPLGSYLAHRGTIDLAHFSSRHPMEVHRENGDPTNEDLTPAVRRHTYLARDSAEQSEDNGHTEIEFELHGPALQVTRLSDKLKGVSVNRLTPFRDERLKAGLC